MCLNIDNTLTGMGLTTADVPTPRVSALMRLKSQNCPQMSVHTSAHTHTHTHTHLHSMIYTTVTGFPLDKWYANCFLVLVIKKSDINRLIFHCRPYCIDFPKRLFYGIFCFLASVTNLYQQTHIHTHN